MTLTFLFHLLVIYSLPSLAMRVYSIKKNTKQDKNLDLKLPMHSPKFNKFTLTIDIDAFTL